MDFVPLAAATIVAIAVSRLPESLSSAAVLLVAAALVAVAASLLLHDEAIPLLQAVPTGPALRHVRRAIIGAVATTAALIAVAVSLHVSGRPTSGIVAPGLALFATANAAYSAATGSGERSAEVGAATAATWFITALVFPSHPQLEHMTDAWRIHPVPTIATALLITIASHRRRSL